MKALFLLILLQVDSTAVESTEAASQIMKFIAENWLTLVSSALPLAWAIARLTPTDKDDKVLAFIVKLLEAIPDNKKGGGTHEKHSKNG